MSNSTAIAAVTATLKDLLDKGLADTALNQSGITKVTTLPPGLLPGDPEDGLNLFLYHLSPNPAWRNATLQERDGRGAPVGSPPLALDLSYMLTAYGKKDFEAELLLGCVMQILNREPLLTKEAISAALRKTGPEWLSTADLADQSQPLKVVPHPIDAVEMSRIWMAFQAPYRPSVAYQVLVVLNDPPRSHR